MKSSEGYHGEWSPPQDPSLRLLLAAAVREGLPSASSSVVGKLRRAAFVPVGPDLYAPPSRGGVARGWRTRQGTSVRRLARSFETRVSITRSPCLPSSARPPEHSRPPAWAHTNAASAPSRWSG